MGTAAGKQAPLPFSRAFLLYLKGNGGDWGCFAGGVMKVDGCRYCHRTTDIVEIVADLEVTTLYLTRDQAYRGRCILALKDHKTEVFQLDAGDVEAFGRDMARASRAIYEAFHPDKINYAAYGDGYPHVHFHLVPKYRGAKSWGSPFDLAEDPAGKVSEEILVNTAALLRSKL
jgi:diadenosine tetraphosphate (Ap4A) HIT family hydrolase